MCFLRMGQVVSFVTDYISQMLSGLSRPSRSALAGRVDPNIRALMDGYRGGKAVMNCNPLVGVNQSLSAWLCSPTSSPYSHKHPAATEGQKHARLGGGVLGHCTRSDWTTTQQCKQRSQLPSSMHTKVSGFRLLLVDYTGRILRSACPNSADRMDVDVIRHKLGIAHLVLFLTTCL